jgi:lipopolysaccharide transport system ATP-binding protein
MAEPAVEFTQVWKRYLRGVRRRDVWTVLRGVLDPRGREDRYLWSLADLSFRVRPGESLGIIGPNGAGKTTTLRLAARITTPTRGSVTARGRVAALINLGAGFHGDLTGRENIFLNGVILGMSRREIAAKFERIVEFAEIGPFLETPVKRYSTGMLARLGFAVAAHVEPEILLVDEVLSVGDQWFQAKSVNRIKELRAQGVTILFVSHNLLAVQALCDRVMLLNQGRVATLGAAADALHGYEAILRSRWETEAAASRPVSPDATRAKPGAWITRVDLCDGSGEARRIFRPQESLRAAVHYHASQRIADPVFGFSFIRQDGVICTWARTKFDGITIPFIEGPGRFEVEVAEIRLTPGLYTFFVGIFDRTDAAHYAIRQEDTFVVEDPQRPVIDPMLGVFHVDVRWRIPAPSTAGRGAAAQDT